MLKSKIEVKSDKVNIRFLVVIVGQACTLRCKDCGNFTPFAPRETLQYDVNDIIRYLGIIVKYSKIHTLQVQGGEPFIYPSLGILLNFIKNCKEIEKCTIATNGTVIPDISIDLLRDEKFRVRISNYQVNSCNRAKVQQWLQSNFIKYDIYDFVGNKGMWFDLGKGYNAREGVESRFRNCAFRDCLTLENGVLGHCSRSVIAQKVQGFNMGGYLFVSDDQDFKKQLRQYIEYPKYMEACCWCKGTESSSLIEAAIQMDKKETLAGLKLHRTL